MPSFCYAAGAEIHTYIASSHCARVCVCVCISIYACVCVCLCVSEWQENIRGSDAIHCEPAHVVCTLHEIKGGRVQCITIVLQLVCSVLQCVAVWWILFACCTNWKVWEPVATAVMHTYCRFIVPVDRMLTWNHNGQACSMFTIGGESQSKRQSDLVYVIACLSFDWWLLLLPVTVI